MEGSRPPLGVAAFKRLATATQSKNFDKSRYTVAAHQCSCPVIVYRGDLCKAALKELLPPRAWSQSAAFGLVPCAAYLPIGSSPISCTG